MNDIEWCDVPAGSFTMGSNPADEYPPDDDEAPEHRIEPRVVRGGSFIHGPGEIRCSYRHGLLPGAVDHYVGFRLAALQGARLSLDVDMVDVPAGEVLLGNDPRSPGGPAPSDEAPRQDMAGDVWEWVSSVYAPYPYDALDGREDPSSGLARVLRGGSYASPSSRNLRCAARSRSAPGRRSPHIGFRIACDGSRSGSA